MFFGNEFRHQTGNTHSNVNCGIMVFRRKLSGQHNMTVQNTANRIGNRLVGIVSFHEHGIDTGYRTFLEGACPFQKARELRINGRSISSCNRRLPCRKTNLSLCHGKTGQGIHHQKDIHSLIPEILCNGRRHERCLQPKHRRLVGSRHHQNGTPHSFLSEVFLYELQNFSTTLSDKGNHIDIRLDISGNHPHQSRLSDTGTGEDADTLPLTNGI